MNRVENTDFRLLNGRLRRNIVVYVCVVSRIKRLLLRVLRRISFRKNASLYHIPRDVIYVAKILFRLLRTILLL